MAELEGKFKDTKNNDQREPQLVINSLDFSVVPNRLPIHRSVANGIFLYGNDNNYPRKIVNSADRCSSIVAVRKKQVEFVEGNGFPGATANDVKNGTAVVINRHGETAYDLHKFCAEQKGNINIAIHVNYNALGIAAEFNLIEYDFVRRKIPLKNEEYDRYIITNIWHLENDYSSQIFTSKITEFNAWVKDKKKDISFVALECFGYDPNPLVVRKQMEISGGIQNYPGQLFYAKRTQDIYQKAPYDSLADKFQFLAECDLASLSNIQNGYAGSGFLKYFTNADGTEEIKAIKEKAKNVRGSINQGRFFTIPLLPNSDGKMPTNMWESTEIQNKDKLYTEQKKEAKEGIQEIYATPNSILGNDSEGNFATQNMQDAFDFYNSITQPIRTELEIELTTLFKNSVFANQIQLPIEIEPLQYISRTQLNKNKATEAEGDGESAEDIATRKNGQAKLKSTGTGIQSILSIQEKVSTGITQYDSGIEMLMDIYGYTDEKARKILGEPIELFDKEAKKVDKTTKTESDEDTDND